MAMRKVITPQLVTCRGEQRLIIAIDQVTGQVELAPRTNVRDVAAGGEEGGSGLQYIGGPPLAGETVSAVECEPRPDHSPHWPWPTT
jgi:hypothetical protein